jgi:hypothetical protein
MALGRHGDHGNIFNEHIYKADEDAVSDVFDTHFGDGVHVFGSVNGPGAVRLQFSQDRENWYNGPSVDADEDGHFDLRESGIQARYVRLKVSMPDWASEDEDEQFDDERMITATLVAKTTR